MQLLKRLFKGCKPDRHTYDDMKYLIVGLGNIGTEYQGTRHNAGFMVVDSLADRHQARWTLQRRAYRTEIKHQGRTLVLIKPTTFMNLSGEAVRYWMQA